MKRFLLILFLLSVILLPIMAMGSSDSSEISETTSEAIETAQDVLDNGLAQTADNVADWGVNKTIDGILAIIGSVLDEIYVMFFNAFTLSFENVKTLILPKILGALLLVEIVYLAIMTLIQGEMPISKALQKFFVVLIVIVVANNMNLIVEGLSVIFSSMGFIAGDSSYQGSWIEETPQGTIFQPSDILTAVRGMISPLWTLKEAIDEYRDLLISTMTGFFKINFGALVEWLSLTFAGWLIYIIMLVLVFLISFCSLNVTFWLVEFSFLMVIATLLIPWQIFDPVKFTASGIWQALIGQAIKILCVVMIVAMAPTLFENSIFSQNIINTAEAIAETGGVPTIAIFTQIVITVLVVGAYCYFLMKAPAIAKALIVGQPTMETLASHTVAKTVAGAATGAAMLPLSAGGAAVTGLAGILSRIFHHTRHSSNSSNESPNQNGGSQETNTSKFAGDTQPPPQQPQPKTETGGTQSTPQQPSSSYSGGEK